MSFFFLNYNGKFFKNSTIVLIQNDIDYPTIIACMEFVPRGDSIGYWRETFFSYPQIYSFRKIGRHVIIDRRHGAF